MTKYRMFKKSDGRECIQYKLGFPISTDWEDATLAYFPGTKEHNDLIEAYNFAISRKQENWFTEMFRHMFKGKDEI